MNVFIIFWIHRPACTVRKRCQWRAWTEELKLTRHANNSLGSWESSLDSLRRNGFQSSYCVKVGARAKEMALFCFRPNFLDELERKTLATQLKLLLVACTIAFQIRTRICFNTSFRTCLSHLSALTNIWMSQGSLISGSYILWLFQNTDRRASYLYFCRWSAARYSVLSVNELHVLGMASGWLYVVLSVRRRLNFQSRQWPVVR